MPWTNETALVDDAIADAVKTHSGYSFWLKGVPTEIRIVLLVNPLRGGFNFHVSHSIHTPKQLGPYHPSTAWGDYEAYALHQAVTSITQHYSEAVAGGLEPSPDWLIENPFHV